MLRLKEAMAVAGVTGKQLATAIDISPVSVSAMVTGKTSPSLHTLKRIAYVLDIDIKDLFISTKGSKTKAEVVAEIKRLADELL